MSADHTDPISRAKADLVELERKINMMNSEISKMEMQRNGMSREASRIQAFIELSGRYTGNASMGGIVKPVSDTAETSKPSPLKLVVPKIERKPDGIPPMPDMIRAAIKSAGHAIEPREMTDFIKKKWWPNVKAESVGPIAWRMAERKELKKDGPKYKLLPPSE